MDGRAACVHEQLAERSDEAAGPSQSAAEADAAITPAEEEEDADEEEENKGLFAVSRLLCY